MGQNVSKDTSPPPLTFRDCLAHGQLDSSRYYSYRRRLHVLMLGNNRMVTKAKKKRKRQLMELDIERRIRTPRSVKRHKLMVRDKDGTLREIRPEDTLWYLLYVAQPPSSKRMMKLFRLRFRLPHSSFVSLCATIKTHELFRQWTRCDAVGCYPSNLDLLLLGALRYIGRAWTLDDVCEANGISIDTNSVFLYRFMEYGSTVLYKKWVLEPSITNSVEYQEKFFRLAGFNGCIGSSDATHIPMLKCPQWAHIAHKGFKLSVPARTYNVTVDHSRRIIGSTMGHPGTWNDKTLVLFDDLLCNVKNGKLHQDFEFKLMEKNDEGEMVEALYKGVWFMMDNGYLYWSCTVPPDGNATRYDIIRFSEWLESMRKDVECLFGIMKGRFCILRYGFRFKSIATCDMMWLTCCSLHNILLEVDGLDKNWENGVRSDWEKLHKNFMQNGNQQNIETPFAITRLNRHFASEEDSSEEEVEEEQAGDATTNLSMRLDKYAIDGARIVSKIPLSLFKEALVQHFNIRFQKNDIIWPKRINLPTN